MKKILNVLSFLVISVLVLAQSSEKKESLAIPVRITNWGDRGRLIAENFFTETKDSIISQIGSEEFEKVKKYSSVFSWPKSLQGKIWYKSDSLMKKEFHRKLDKLKVYQIANYCHYWEGSKDSRFSIIRVPYSDNMDWDKEAKWDTVYFIVQERSVKKLNP